MVYCCKVSPNDSSSVLIGSEDKCVTKLGTKYKAISIEGEMRGHSKSVRCIDISEDGLTVASGCDDHSLRLWDYQTCKPRAILVGHRGTVSGVSFVKSNQSFSEENEEIIISCSFD